MANKVSFRTQDEIINRHQALCRNRSDAAFLDLGSSEEGRPLYAVVLGNGPRTISLMAGAHADEPVGPETLRYLIDDLILHAASYRSWLNAFRFVIIPQINPDGEARNQQWIRQWPNLEAFIKYVDREPPGRDLEFGFPNMRKENQIVSQLLASFAPVDLHMSMHGMAFSDGIMVLIERSWIKRTKEFQAAFQQKATELGLARHDHDRDGEKGFTYIGPGFTTTPRGAAMREYFNELGDPQTAALFHDSSMEYVRSLGGDPLCLVTELPMFQVHKTGHDRPGYPATYLAFKSKLPALRQALLNGESIQAQLKDFTVDPFPLQMALQLQRFVIEQGVRAVL